MARAIWIVALFVAGFAGCTESEEFALDTYTLTATGIPGDVGVNETFTFTLTAVGALDATSDHVGAHYWSEEPSDPTAALGDARACEHLPSPEDVPDMYEVSCTIDAPGTYHVYGHLRITHEGTTYDYWALPHEVTVA